MPLSPNTFSWTRGLTAAKQSYFQVSLKGPRGTSLPFMALLDTGASHSLVDQALAIGCGHAITGLSTLTIQLAGGASMAIPFIMNVTIVIERHSVVIPKLLLSPVSTTPLLAAQDFLLATEFGVDRRDIFYD